MSMMRPNIPDLPIGASGSRARPEKLNRLVESTPLRNLTVKRGRSSVPADRRRRDYAGRFTGASASRSPSAGACDGAAQVRLSAAACERARDNVSRTAAVS